MVVKSLRANPPTDDKRWLIVNATMRKHGYQPHALIETLHTVQETFGFIDDPALRFVTTSLDVALSHAMGVATFYHFFSMKPPGKHSCVVCTGTACYIKGSSEILNTIDTHFHVQDGETTENGELSILTARCLGACGLAPVVVLDGETIPKADPAEIVPIVEGAINNGS